MEVELSSQSTDNIYTHLAQIEDATSEATTYVNVAIKTMLNLTYGEQYNFVLGSESNGDLQLYSMNSYTNEYANSA